MSKVKEEKPTYHIQDVNIQNGCFNKEQSDAVSAVAKALEANANALGVLARSVKGPENVQMEAGIKIG